MAEINTKIDYAPGAAKVEQSSKSNPTHTKREQIINIFMSKSEINKTKRKRNEKALKKICKYWRISKAFVTNSQLAEHRIPAPSHRPFPLPTAEAFTHT